MIRALLELFDRSVFDRVTGIAHVVVDVEGGAIFCTTKTETY